MRRCSLVALVALVLAGCSVAEPPAPERSTEPGTPSVEESAPEPPADEEDFFLPLPEMNPALGAEAAAAYTGVVQIVVGPTCSATIIDTGADDAPAYALTNGHCAGGWGDYGDYVATDVEAFGTVNAGLVTGVEPGPQIEVASIVYGTMREVDLALVELDATLGEVRAMGIEPVPLAANNPEPGSRVVNVGVPVRDLPADEWVLRGGECTLREQVDLLEMTWSWLDAWANDCPGVVMGHSGSPLISEAGEVVAVINTTTYAGLVRGGECWINNPCEITADGVEVVPQTSYASPVAGLGACFVDGVFTLTEACPLPAPAGVAAAPVRAAVTLAEVVAGESVGITVRGAEPGEVRHGVVAVSDPLGCASEDVYSLRAVVAAGDLGDDPHGGNGLIESSIAVTFPPVEGFYWWCATTGTAAEASRAIVHVDGTPPVFTPRILVEESDGVAWVTPTFVHPELSDTLLKHGPAAEVDCADDAGYQQFLSVAIMVEASERPVRVCLRSFDMAGNAAPVVERVLD